MPDNDLTIKNARILQDDRIVDAEISIHRGKIVQVGKILTTYGSVLDAKGALVLPAGIDSHVHFREPGYKQKEDWHTGSSAAAAGGITTVIEHPNTYPPTVDAGYFKEKLKKAKNKSVIDFALNAGVIGDSDYFDNNLKHLSTMWGAGACAFGEIFMATSTGNMAINKDMLHRALGEIKELDAIACIHAEDEVYMKTADEVERYSDGYSRMRPNIAEAFAVGEAIDLAKDNRLHLCHISARESIGMIRQARSLGRDNITCEVAPHHLMLHMGDWERLGPFGKMNPPLRNRGSTKAMWNALNDGTIDILASDHAPHTIDEKTMNVWDAPAGVPGVETMYPLMLAAVKNNLVHLSRVVDAISRRPAEIFSLTGKGHLEAGYDADLIFVNSKDIAPIEAVKLHSKCKWTPYEGMEAIFPYMTFSRGEMVWDGEEIMAKPGSGKFLAGAGFGIVKEPEDA